MSRRVPSEERRHESLPLFDIPAARAQGHAAAESASSHASRIEPGWKAECLAAVRAYADTHSEPFLSEDALASVAIPEGADRRAFGAIMKDAERLGYIAPAGYAPAKSSNGAPKTAWASCIFKRTR